MQRYENPPTLPNPPCLPPGWTFGRTIRLSLSGISCSAFISTLTRSVANFLLPWVKNVFAIPLAQHVPSYQYGGCHPPCRWSPPACCSLPQCPRLHVKTTSNHVSGDQQMEHTLLEGIDYFRSFPPRPIPWRESTANSSSQS
jgi:hypothetical protein